MKEFELNNMEKNKEVNEGEGNKTLFTFEKESCGCGGNCNGSCK